jgi:hypothetical protein
MLQNNAVTATDMRPGRKGKTRLRTLDRIDQRTVSARRTRELIALWTEALGGDVSPVQAMAITHAAACVALCEDAQSRRLAGDTSITAETVVKFSNVAQRAIKQLALPSAGPRSAKTGLKRLKLLP